VSSSSHIRYLCFEKFFLTFKIFHPIFKFLNGQHHGGQKSVQVFIRNDRFDFIAGRAEH